MWEIKVVNVFETPGKDGVLKLKEHPIEEGWEPFAWGVGGLWLRRQVRRGGGPVVLVDTLLPGGTYTETRPVEVELPREAM